MYASPAAAGSVPPSLVVPHPDAPRCWRVQKQMYQQQPATVGLRGQAPNRYPPPAPRPQQRPVDVQQLQNSSLSIHDKRRQPVAPLKR